MCIVFWKETKNHYIILGNRDEFLSRPTTSARWHHSFSPSLPVLSGLDLEAGGTWLGLSITDDDNDDASADRKPSRPTKNLRFATLTNFTEPPSTSKKPSRGHLVKDYLVSSSRETRIEEYLVNLDRIKSDYAGFNLIMVEWSPSEQRWSMSYSSNRDGKSSRVISSTQQGIQNRTEAVSNSTFETSISALESQSTNEQRGGEERRWPKVMSGCDRLDQLIEDDEHDEDVLVQKAWQLLSTANPAPILDRTHLRYTILVRPLFMNISKPPVENPPAFIPAPEGTLAPQPDDLSAEVFDKEKREGQEGYWYGTRVQSCLLIDKHASRGRAVFVERDAYEMGTPDDTKEGRRIPRWSGKERRFEIKDWVP